MTMDRIIALVAFAAFATFIGILMAYVQHTDLLVICALVLVMCFVDLWITSKPKGQG